MFFLKSAADTHNGRIRGNNEDNLYLCGSYKKNTDELTAVFAGEFPDDMALFSVCDGMGGEERGELASLIAVEQLSGCAREDTVVWASETVRKANELICNETLSNGSGRMGTTLACLYVDSGAARVCNVGDSRVYRFRDGALTQLSRDHTKAETLILSGVLTPEQARTHDSRHRLTQHLGIFPEELIIEPFFSQELLLRHDDIFLLCSDGLTDMLDDRAISDIISKRDTTPAELCSQLVCSAIEAGGRDNVTAMVVEVCAADASNA